MTRQVRTSSLFGVAAFAQPAMGRVFLAGQGNALGHEMFAENPEASIATVRGYLDVPIR
jgi:hypothetical protein